MGAALHANLGNQVQKVVGKSYNIGAKHKKTGRCNNPMCSNGVLCTSAHLRKTKPQPMGLNQLEMWHPQKPKKCVRASGITCAHQCQSADNMLTTSGTKTNPKIFRKILVWIIANISVHLSQQGSGSITEVNFKCGHLNISLPKSSENAGRHSESCLNLKGWNLDSFSPWVQNACKVVPIGLKATT